MVRYAIIDSENVLVGISNLLNVVPEKPDMILVSPEFDFELRTKKWTGTDWEDYTDPIPEPQPSQLDRIEALAVAGNDIEEKTLGEVTNLGESNLIIMEALATQYEEGLENDLNNKEVLATIYEELLAQKEVK